MIAVTVFVSCGNNSSDKETTATTDTITTAMADTVTAVVPMTDTSKTIAVNVPAKTKKGFEEKYPKATDVKWESNKPATKDKDVEWDLPENEDGTGVDEEGHNAWFHWQGNDSKAYYDKQSNWVSTVDVISDPASLPAAVTSSIKNQFAGYTVTSVRRENDKSRTKYKVILEKGDERIKAVIDENGTMLKKK